MSEAEGEYISDYCSDGPCSGRSSLKGVNPERWMTPMAAEGLLNGLTDLPMKPRDYLIFLAEHSSILTIANVIYFYSDSSGTGRHADLPLLTEWESPAWTSPYADLWFNGTMRVPGQSYIMAVEYRDIRFERAGVQRVVDRFSAAQSMVNLPTGMAGRPTKGAGLILAEMARRSERGELLATVTDEAKALMAWLAVNHTQVQQPRLNTVRNNIRDTFRCLKSDA